MDPEGYENENEGGFINPRHGKPRVQKVQWNQEKDRKLLLLGLGRHIFPKEYQAIADSFPEKPTAKAIQERLQKLRKEQLEALGKLKTEIAAPTTGFRDPLPDDEDEDIAKQIKAAKALLSLRKSGTASTAPPTSPSAEPETRPTKKRKTLASVLATTAEDDGFEEPEEPERPASTKKKAVKPSSTIPDPAEEYLDLGALVTGLEPKTEKQKLIRKQELARLQHARQMVRETAAYQEFQRVLAESTAETGQEGEGVGEGVEGEEE